MRVSPRTFIHTTLLLMVFPFNAGAAVLEKVTSHPAVDYQPAPSRDGRFLAFVSERGGNPDIWLKSLSAGVVSLPRQLTTHPAVDRDPALNQDGSKMLYVSHKTDPRGDVYLMDVLTGEDRQLTDLTSADSSPQWGPDGRTFFYLKQDVVSGKQSVVRRQLNTDEEQYITGDVSAFGVGRDGWIVLAQVGGLSRAQTDTPEKKTPLTSEIYLDLWPALSDSSPDGRASSQTFYFTRYEEDSNGDGVLDADDESSIWMGQWNDAMPEKPALYRMTPSGQFHLYPAVAKEDVYFTDLKLRDIFRLHAPSFLEDYATFEQAHALATRYLDRGQRELGLLVQTNISRNLTASLPFPQRAEFDFTFAESLMEAGKHMVAKQVLVPYLEADGTIGALAQIHSIVLDVYEHAGPVSLAERKRLVEDGITRLMGIGQEYRSDDGVYGQALIEAGRLHLLAEDFLAALDYLVKVDELESQEMRAKALFTRGTVYRGLGDETSLLKVFVDVIGMFGENSSWGRRAVEQAIAVSEQGEDVHQQVASLTNLVEAHHALPLLSASTRFRIAELYDEQGEQLKAIQTLNTILAAPPPFPELVVRSYRRKAEILSASERYQEAAKTYAALAELTGEGQAEWKQARKLMVLQLVRQAEKDRAIGEVRIAAKGFRQILQKHPTSVEAHRGYIETKVMLKETDEVQAFYRGLVKNDPDNSVYLYGHGLALTYSKPPNFPTIIEVLERVIRMDFSASYYHQTLGWAYEQEERLGGKKGFLEQAEGEYRIALELNDGFQFPDVESNLLLNLGNTSMALNNYREAYRHFLQRDHLQVPTRDNVTELLYRKNYGEAAFKAGKSEESLSQYRLALKRVPPDNKALKAELLERIGLSHQDLGHSSEAVQSFSQAMELNLELGNKKNLALLQRNIGVNLYNLSGSDADADKAALKKALLSYFASLENIQQFGVKEQKKATGLFSLDVAIGKEGSEAATGFDRQGEEKLMFSYIAGTYEKLSEPERAREYYLKKLDLIALSPSAETDVARLTEKAIVLNRLGLLSYHLGSLDEALDYIRQSLGYTTSLDLQYGTRVNLYNISRLASERFLAGESINASLVDLLVTGLDQLVQEERHDVQTFHALANTAFLLYYLPEPSFVSLKDLEHTVQDYHRHYAFKSRVWTYYTRAQEILTSDGIVAQEEVGPYLMLLKLNMMELAQEAEEQEAYDRLQREVGELVEQKGAPHGWLWYLAQGERTNDPQQRQSFLREAFEALMRLPPQVQPKGNGNAIISSLEGLSRLFVDSLVAEGAYDQAFAVIEQIDMRKISTVLYEELDEGFVLEGVGDYREVLESLLADMRAASRAGDRDLLEALSAEFEEVTFALYEEHPWAVSFFSQYPPTKDRLSGVLHPGHPYLKVVQGEKGVHGFVHDGTMAHYVPLGVVEVSQLGEEAQHLLEASDAIYLSVPQHLESVIGRMRLEGKHVTRVNTFYDFLNAFHQRTLFYTKVAIAGDFELAPGLQAGEIPMSARVFTGDPEQDRTLLENFDVLIATGKPSAYAFEVKEDLGVHDVIGVSALPSGSKHTALLVSPPSRRSQDTGFLVSAFIRAGFTHVLVNRGPYEKQTAQQFTALYLAHLADHPADEAVSLASTDLFGEGRVRSPFVLYGYAGMNETQKAEFASSLYSDELNEAVALYQDDQYAPSLRKMENALSVIDYAGKNEEFVDLTNLAVDAAFKIGDYRRAVFHQEKLLKALGTDAGSEEQSEGLYRLGILYSRFEQFDVAIQYLEQAIALWEQAEELDRLAEGIATLGVVKENMGAYSDALKEFGRSFELYQEIGEIGDVATQYRRIGRIYYLRLGRYERARENLFIALESYRELENRRGECETLFEIGLTYEKMGLFDQADGYYREGTEIANELEDPFLLASGQLYLANTAWFRGIYQEAFQLLSQAEQLAARAEDAQLTIMVANTRGLMYWTLNDSDKGLTYLKRAVALAEDADIPTELASSFNNLGLMYRQREDYGTSLDYFEKAKEIDERLNSRWGLGYDYRNIGMSLLKLGKLTEAESNFLKAEHTSAEINNAVNWVKALLELGNVNRDLRKPEKALRYYEQAYERAKQFGIKEVEWRAAAGIAGLLRDGRNREEAFRWFAAAVEIVEGMRASLKIDELRNSFQVNKLDLYRDTISLLVDMGRIEEAFNYLERSRSRSFIDLLGNQKLTLKNEADQEALEKVGSLLSEVESLKTELGSYEEPPTDVLERYQEAKALYDEALIELKLLNPGLSSFVSVDPLTQQDIQKLLEPEVGLLSYLIVKNRLFLWLLRHNGVTFFQIPVREGEIAETVKRYRGLIQRLESVDAELKKLYGWLIQPVENDLTGLQYLGIIPDGPLHFLSFSALKNDKGYLIDQYPLFYSPSASVLKFTFAKRKTQKATKVLALGNPDLGDYNYDLPLAELEAESIRWNYPDMDILTGSKATKEWFVEHISQYGIIHLAAHGEFDEVNPLSSSLWLASALSDNRRLTVKEVFGLDINADLVTLSACQTGLGKLKAGELIGLNRAFIYAGTHALVSALWRVDDLSTSVMMKHFYRNYVTMDKAKSLRQAQLIVKKEFPHPSYWAGFNLVGDYL